MVEASTGIKLDESYSDHRGGDYFYGENDGGDILKLMINEDVQDGEPLVDGADEFGIVISLFVETDVSPVLKGLLAAPDKFVKVVEV